MANIELRQARELAVNFAESLEIKDKAGFVQNAIILAQDEKTKDYDFKDVLSCLMRADRYGVSLVKGEASMYPVNTKVGQNYIKKPLLIVDYKFQWQQVLENGDCKTFNIIPVLECDTVRRSIIGHEWEPGDDDDSPVVGYYGYYEGLNGLRVGLYMTKEKILGKLPQNNRNDLYKAEDNQSEWLFKKMVLRQICKQIPNSRKIESTFALEDSAQAEPVQAEKSGKKMIAPVEPVFDSANKEEDGGAYV